MEKELTAKINSLKSTLEDRGKFDLNTLIGVDGFVDEIVHAVATRNNVEDYERIKTIREFGERIIKAAGLSTNIEMVPQNIKLGGNGPIMSNALIEYGADVTYIGALGIPAIHAVFRDMAERCNAISIAKPGHTDAVEFEDGKLMLGKIETMKDITWDVIKEKVGVEKLASLLAETDLLGLVNWTMVPFMNGIWEGMINEVFPLLPESEKERYVFFDLADPEKRTREDILEALKLIKRFSSHFKVILGLNKKEALEIANVLEIKEDGIDDMDKVNLKELVCNLGQELEIYCLVVHPVDQSVAYVDDVYYQADGPYTANPVLTTGAGDNFNAGFCVGQALGLTVEQSLLLGNATSGFYVRNAKSPTREDILNFLAKWEKGQI